MARAVITVILVLFSADVWAGVTIQVQAANNLADTDDPIPTLWVFNQGSKAITFDVFAVTPFTHIEKEHESSFVRYTCNMCGNGFVPHRMGAGQTGSFPLWSLVSHGPGISGTYRVALPITVGKSHTEVFSDPFDLNYGDVAPAHWVAGSTPGTLVLGGAETEVVDDAGTLSHAPAEMYALVGTQLRACATGAQNAIPWIRGSFTLVIYRYPSQKVPVSYVSASLLGSKELDSCIEKIPIPADYVGYTELHMAVTHPTAPAA